MRFDISKTKIDWTAVRTAARTAGALMIGNVFVAAMLLGNRNWLLLISLLVIGTLLIILTSIEKRKE